MSCETIGNSENPADTAFSLPARSREEYFRQDMEQEALREIAQRGRPLRQVIVALGCGLSREPRNDHLWSYFQDRQTEASGEEFPIWVTERSLAGAVSAGLLLGTSVEGRSDHLDEDKLVICTGGFTGHPDHAFLKDGVFTTEAQQMRAAMLRVFPVLRRDRIAVERGSWDTSSSLENIARMLMYLRIRNCVDEFTEIVILARSARGVKVPIHAGHFLSSESLGFYMRDEPVILDIEEFLRFYMGGADPIQIGISRFIPRLRTEIEEERNGSLGLKGKIKRVLREDLPRRDRKGRCSRVMARGKFIFWWLLRSRDRVPPPLRHPGGNIRSVYPEIYGWL